MPVRIPMLTFLCDYQHIEERDSVSNEYYHWTTFNVQYGKDGAGIKEAATAALSPRSGPAQCVRVLFPQIAGCGEVDSPRKAQVRN
jgi:hypothetical protein